MQRVVSLLPSITEIVCALGFGERLVGRSHECDFPPEVRTLPALTEAKLDVRKPSAGIDLDVKTLLRDGLSVYRVDVERALARWQGGAPRVLSLDPRTLRDVFRSFTRVAEALGAPERGRDLAEALSNRLTDLAQRAAAAGTPPSVACVEWIDPLMSAGNWMPELVSLAGGRSLFGEVGRHSPWISWAALRDADPDVLVVLPCGFDLARTRAELAPLRAQPGFESLRAVTSGRAYLVDGNQYMNRPGPRLVDSLEILGELIHPEAFPPAHRGAAWEPL